MTTIELTGAEEVAWDLSDLYASGDDPRIEGDFAEAETATAAFRDRYYGKVATLSAAALAEAIDASIDLLASGGREARRVTRRAVIAGCGTFCQGIFQPDRAQGVLGDCRWRSRCPRRMDRSAHRQAARHGWRENARR